MILEGCYTLQGGIKKNNNNLFLRGVTGVTTVTNRYKCYTVTPTLPSPLQFFLRMNKFLIWILILPISAVSQIEKVDFEIINSLTRCEQLNTRNAKHQTLYYELEIKSKESAKQIVNVIFSPNRRDAFLIWKGLVDDLVFPIFLTGQYFVLVNLGTDNFLYKIQHDENSTSIEYFENCLYHF